MATRQIEKVSRRMIAAHVSRGRVLVATGVLTVAFGWRVCVSAQDDSRSLAELSLEELLNTSVTSVSKRETRVNESPAAVFVLTGEDIRRSGATSVPEALRMVPGLDVARINADDWAVSSRGFNS